VLHSRPLILAPHTLTSHTLALLPQTPQTATQIKMHAMGDDDMTQKVNMLQARAGM
jgi:hypothetical protein